MSPEETARATQSLPMNHPAPVHIAVCSPTVSRKKNTTPVKCAVLNVGASFPIRTSNRIQDNVAAFPSDIFDDHVSRLRNSLSTFTEVFSNRPRSCHWPRIPQPTGWRSSVFHRSTTENPHPAERSPTASRNTNPWHRQCIAVLLWLSSRSA